MGSILVDGFFFFNAGGDGTERVAGLGLVVDGDVESLKEFIFALRVRLVGVHNIFILSICSFGLHLLDS